eukprot:c43678_g1_i1 orf=59-280(-)
MEFDARCMCHLGTLPSYFSFDSFNTPDTIKMKKTPSQDALIKRTSEKTTIKGGNVVRALCIGQNNLQYSILEF